MREGGGGGETETERKRERERERQRESETRPGGREAGREEEMWETGEGREK